MKVVGLDLAGLDRNETGFCFLNIKDGKKEITSKSLLSDREILNEIENVNPDVITIDAPFDFPKVGMFRESDLMMKKRGFKPLSPMFPGMKVLVQRARMLVKILRGRGFLVKETFPRAVEKILGFEKNKSANEHEYDALLCAVAGQYFLEDRYENLGGIILPKK